MAPAGYDNLHKLIVNYLPKDLSEEDVSNLFSVFGKVHSCKLMIDLKTNESKGWCFVNYFELEDARNAVNSYNGLKMRNKVIRVSFAGDDAPNKVQVFVCGLKLDTSKEDVERIFSEFGPLSWCYVMPKGAALVRFENRDDANKAIEALDGRKIEDNPYPIKVSLHESSRGRTKPRGEEEEDGGGSSFSGKAASSFKAKLNRRFSPVAPLPPSAPAQVCTLFVSGLPADFEEASLYKMFSPYGAIAKASLMMEGDKCKGVAFVDMMKHCDAETAIDALNNTMVGERFLKVAFKTKSRRQQGQSQPSVFTSPTQSY